MTTRTRKPVTSTTITVGARRSCTFNPAPIGARLGNGDLSERQLDLLATMSKVDYAVYHAPLDTPRRKVRARKSAPLASTDRSGASALASDDLPTIKRTVYKAISYISDGGEVLVAIFGGMSPNAVGLTLSKDQADAAIERGTLTGNRVVLWPSEMQRRGAAPTVAIADDASAADLRAEYPIIALRPAPVAALIESARAAECYPDAGRIAA